MIKLPEQFQERMRHTLKEDYDAFLACYDSDGYAGLRVNTSKITVEKFLELCPFHLIKVPWTTNGFYYDKKEEAARHPYYYAGLYYIQEPSAMLPASYLHVEKGMKVLDLCAAPGGKSTELCSKLFDHTDSILVSNDVSASRAKALVKNLSVWGSRYSMITGETPAKLNQAFGQVFDRILVDAPCSGEGMFRKDTSLIKAWESRGPEDYAPIQYEILEQAVKMLKPGGMIAYSTCTFSREEDEEIIEKILQNYPKMHMVELPHCDGFSAGMIYDEEVCDRRQEDRNQLSYAIRLWPHRIQGEGHFLAVLQKDETETGYEKSKQQLIRYTPSEIAKKNQKIPTCVAEFLKRLPESLVQDRICQAIGEQLMLMPPYKIPKLRYLLTGINLGEVKKNRFEPSQALAMVLSAKDFDNTLQLSVDDPRVIRYLKGETLELTEEEEANLDSGWTLLCIDDYSLGWGKHINGTIRNKYYQGWRMQ